MPPTTPAPKLELPAWASERLRPERTDPEPPPRRGGPSPSRYDNVNGRTQQIPQPPVDQGRVLAEEYPNVIDSGGALGSTANTAMANVIDSGGALGSTANTAWPTLSGGALGSTAWSTLSIEVGR